MSLHQYITITITLPGNVALGRIATSTPKEIKYSSVVLLNNISFSGLISKSFSHQKQGRKLTAYSHLVTSQILSNLSPCQIHTLSFFVSLENKQSIKRKHKKSEQDKTNRKKNAPKKKHKKHKCRGTTYTQLHTEKSYKNTKQEN